jgi:hypothetical protein
MKFRGSECGRLLFLTHGFLAIADEATFRTWKKGNLR